MCLCGVQVDGGSRARKSNIHERLLQEVLAIDDLPKKSVQKVTVRGQIPISETSNRAKSDPLGESGLH